MLVSETELFTVKSFISNFVYLFIYLLHVCFLKPSLRAGSGRHRGRQGKCLLDGQLRRVESPIREVLLGRNSSLQITTKFLTHCLRYTSFIFEKGLNKIKLNELKGKKVERQNSWRQVKYISTPSRLRRQSLWQLWVFKRGEVTVCIRSTPVQKHGRGRGAGAGSKGSVSKS